MAHAKQGELEKMRGGVGWGVPPIPMRRGLTEGEMQSCLAQAQQQQKHLDSSVQ